MQYSEDGFHLAASGGKDSQILLELTKLAGVKYSAHMQMTGVDPPELLHFLRNNYPEVILHPPQRSIYQLIRDKGFLPTRRHRYCCQILKEQHAGGTVTLLGIRAEESEKRALRSVFASGYRHLDVDQFNMDQEKLLTCVNGKDKLILSPILH